MKKFYVASSFSNIDTVRYVGEQLELSGYIQTYDWTKNERAATFDKLKRIGQEEKNGVLEADFIIILLPGGKGTHVELGIALGQGKRIFLHSPNGEVHHVETTSSFYHLAEVEKCFGTLDELIIQVMANDTSQKKDEAEGG